jgi:Ion channel
LGILLTKLKKYWNERNNFKFLLSVLVIYIFVIIPVFRERISGEFLLGGIIVYLLLSFIFGMLFHAVYLLNGRASFHGLVTGNRPEFIYFSLSTITTAAFGDITPVHSFARSLSNLESLTRQLYPSILLARLVAMGFTTSKQDISI